MVAPLLVLLLGRVRSATVLEAVVRKAAEQSAGRSPDTAQRDIAELVDLGILERNPGVGRRTSYRFNGPPQPEPTTAPEDLPTPPEDENDEGFYHDG